MAKLDTGIQYPWTKEQMAAWLAASIVYQSSAKVGEETYHFAFKKPEWPIMKRVSSLVNQKDNVTAGEVLLENCWLAGHDQIKADPALYLGACLAAVNAIADNMPTFETKLVKS